MKVKNILIEDSLKQSNSLIRCTKKLTSNQLKLFFFACSQRKYGEDVVITNYPTCCEKLGIAHGGNQYTTFLKSIKNIVGNSIITIQNDYYDFVSTIFSSFSINKESGEIEIQFNPSVIPLLEDIEDSFTYLHLCEISKLDSKYSIRLYELFKSYLGKDLDKAQKSYDIDELLTLLDCPDSHKRFDVFETKVLKQALKEINEKTDIKFSYTKKRYGRRIRNVKFVIEKNSSYFDKKTKRKQTKKQVDTNNDLMNNLQKLYEVDDVTF